MGDGVIAMAVLGTTIMYGYRLLEPWLIKYLRLSSQELQVCAHIHWVVASFFLTMALIFASFISSLISNINVPMWQQT
ncbi:MAG: hypothetical protein HRU34_04485 [Richelia sp.]|nr:hypothetical protein [Richelia sp.]